MEPGEAVALNAGYLVTEVMDIVKNEIQILILDASASLPYAGCVRDALSPATSKWISAG